MLPSFLQVLIPKGKKKKNLMLCFRRRCYIKIFFYTKPVLRNWKFICRGSGDGWYVVVVLSANLKLKVVFIGQQPLHFAEVFSLLNGWIYVFATCGVLSMMKSFEIVYNMTLFIFLISCYCYGSLKSWHITWLPLSIPN